MALPSYFAQRRRHLMDAFGPGAVILVPSARFAIRNHDVEHEWRQDSDFWYLSGFDEPDSLLALCPGRKDGEYVLLVRARDKAMETWNGRRVGVERACELLGADQALDIKEIDAHLGKLLEGAREVVWPVGRDSAFDQSVFKAARRHRSLPRLHLDGPDHFTDLALVLSEMRLFKSPEEVAILRRAGQLTSEGHHEAMRMCQPGVNERQLQAGLEFVFRAGGSQRVGYGSIVARGDNATILHYRENNEVVRDGDLVLIDAGAEVDYLTADITRTFPASGKFSPEQKAIYELVLDAQLKSIELCRTNNRFIDVHNKVLEVLTQGLVDLGLLKGEVAELIAEEKYKRFYMHRTSHWLGMDVHDTGRYHDSLPSGNLSAQFQPGMVLTVEPGLYIASDDLEVPEQFRGIGVRIEDDILITDGDPDVLTADCVKSVADVEALVGRGGQWIRRWAP
jgi:Xaa-Pro aminopeptidase